MALRLGQAARTSRRKLGFWGSRANYWRHLIGLFRPGWQVVVPAAHPVEASSLQNWGDEDLKLMIEEGRRQFDRQFFDFEHVLSRAQWVFAFGAAGVASLFAALVRPRPSGF